MEEGLVGISIDVGADTVKSAFAYFDKKKIVSGKFVADSLSKAPFESMAYYDKKNKKWLFGDEVRTAAKASFQYIVKIKDLLNLLCVKEVDNSKFFFEGHSFPNFYFPPIEYSEKLDSFQKLIDKQMTFIAEQTPKEVCQLFFENYFRQVIFPNFEKLNKLQKSPFKKVSVVVVYPLGVDKEYIAQLKILAAEQQKNFFKTDEPISVFSVPKAIGLAAHDSGLFQKKDSEVNVLVVNIGDAEMSLAKIIYGSRIVADGVDAHSKPVTIGGKDFDRVIFNLLESKIAQRPVLGATGDGDKPMETGSYYEQFMLMNSIKKSKKLFCLPDEKYKKAFGDKGVQMAIERDFTLYVPISRDEFLQGISIGTEEIEGCNQAIYKKIWEYIEKELDSSNSGDIENLLLSGGSAESYGLSEYMKKCLEAYCERTKRTVCLVEPEGTPNEKQEGDFCIFANEDSIYSAAVGGAIYATDKDRFITCASFSYGTWITTENVKTFKSILAKNTAIPSAGGVYKTLPFMVGNGNNYEFIEGEEFFSTTDEVPASKTAFAVGDSGSGTRMQAEKKNGLVVVSKDGIIRFDRPVPGGFYIVEGFSVDEDGKATPFASNAGREKNGNLADVKVWLEGMSNLIVEADAKMRG